MTTIGHRRHACNPVKIVGLHGWCGDSRIFDAILPALDPAAYSLAFVDHRGYGAWEEQPGPFDIAANDAARLADDLGWPDYPDIGQSIGGKAALALAILYGARVSRILAPSPVWARPGPGAEALAFFRHAITDIDARSAILPTPASRSSQPAAMIQ